MAKFHLHSLGFKSDPGDAGPQAPLRARRRRFKAVPIRLVLPNLVTLLALSMGLTSIRFAVEATVLLSIFVHGLSAMPGIGLYARKTTSLAADAPEHRKFR